MKQPDVCPACEQAIEMPTDCQYHSTTCTSCSAHLSIITHDKHSYLFDFKDRELYQHYAGKFQAEKQARFAANGWVRQKTRTNEKAIYENLVEHLKFSLQAKPIVELPSSAIIFDFSDVSCSFPIPTKKQTALESELRKLTIDGFVECAGSDLCFAIDVNHSEYTFVPAEVDPTDLGGWPIPLTPFSEYLAFNNRGFSQGIFVDPRKRQMSVFGDAFENRFELAFRSRLIG